jgi:uncharacterized protein (TIGR03083 family)
MPDETLLDGLDPFELLDRESERVYAHFASGPDWSRPSRCEGWSTRDMLGHLMGLEDYARANLDGRVKALVAEGRAAGARGVDGFNAWQIGEYADVPADALIGRWHAANLAGRAELRERGRHGVVDTSIGEYSSWLQTFHFAVEYATHGDDIYVHVDPADAAERTRWRVAFGAFVLQELEKPVQVATEGDGSVLVSGEPGEIRLDEADFVEASQGRLTHDHPLSKEWRSLLVTVP